MGIGVVIIDFVKHFDRLKKFLVYNKINNVPRNFREMWHFSKSKPRNFTFSREICCA